MNTKIGHLQIKSLIQVNGRKKYLCQCDCGKETEVFAHNLKAGKTRSCGCQMHRAKKNNFVGQRFNYLVIKNELKKRDSSGSVIWNCQCDCGKQVHLSSRQLQKNNIISCGCLKKTSLIGKKFGLLSVFEYSNNKNASKRYWKCQCECGNLTVVSQGNLLSGHTKSCGCLQKKEQRLFADGTCIDVIASKMVPVNNRSGHKGISKSGDKWLAYITFKGKRYALGAFENLNDAIIARKNAENKLFEPLIKKYLKQPEFIQNK
ncbi:AP2 domain-containing protein [Enterococcus sp. MMGLQ5-2]|nr:AP2 domain-containing protein [Enterococcus sp. MMGLQ5-2]MBS7584861.1 AP2 domain-containing protein [Enterococcus sp. MMGLQ5-1]NPD12716.1 AP2 domain-containing protein [Enterococcus sp. MMGLQ5-1]NPD37287.1 AP2 domain-containing protein [Enterococcus sp. MMGLQ5-2]